MKKLQNICQFEQEVKGAVTPVKDAGRGCDSQWAFAAVGALEGALVL